MSLLSYPLFNAPFIDVRTGQISRPWQQWLTSLWQRVGESNSNTLSEVTTAIEAQYLVATSNPELPNERVATNTSTVTWDFTVAGQARANVSTEGIQDVVGGMVADTATIDFTYDDGANTLSAAVKNSSITYGLLQDVSAASRILGRGSAGGSGPVEELTLGTGLSMAGTVVAFSAPKVLTLPADSAGSSQLVFTEDTDSGTETLTLTIPGNLTGTRTVNLPDANTTLVGTDYTQTLSNKTLGNSNIVTLRDDRFTLQDNGDTTKQLTLQLSGLTTATTRTITIPDVSGTAFVSGSVIDQENLFVEAPTNKTYVLVASSRFACTINSVHNLKTVSGTLTLAIQINGTNVTGLSGLAVTSTAQNPAASGANTVAIGDRITGVVTSVSSPVDMEFTLQYTR